ncbi:hypothetical protein DDB_G0293334 [Dictyostelium discoideum AX4]|uniref:Uncharacterized protein n=1 Tax=Dictyostelium discoideum TaxID=44689 RepID=Q54BY4_DICDI|nr:hypothetical protein DDB_G0293334 [Dictyostelium discoideum AX4]EAL60791.1 hypothetical protein DDB_G0293334 [Dictyostelium discoideum AX4]|eukprot:XP_629207.1 hypothetical protein DDB_G0293334 [Dictyostelium discoideum AX4]
MNKNNNIEIKLNYIVFIDIQPYLLYNETFKRILEISLLNKSIFKSTQQIITHQQQLIKFYPSINSIFKYINCFADINFNYDENEFEDSENEDNCKENHYNNVNVDGQNNDDDDDNENYKYKLIQYKDIENLYCKSKDENCLCGIKKFLIENLGSNNKLKHVTLVNGIFAKSLALDPSCNGFFKFNKLILNWDRKEFPWSIPYENEDYANIKLESDFEYSFDYLNRYKPKEIKINTVKGKMKLHITKLNNILKCDSIEKIQFTQHDTPSSFLQHIVSYKSIVPPPPSPPLIKSLTIRLCINDTVYWEDFKNNKNYCSSEIVGKIFKDCQFQSNTTLKELILLETLKYSEIKKNPTYLLESLIGNKSLTTLGLQVFKLWDECFEWKSRELLIPRELKHSLDEVSKYSKTLSPLLKIPTITTLHCDFNSLLSFLQHCNENSNIKTLIVTKGPYEDKTNSNRYSPTLTNDELEFISNFFKQNKSLQVFGLRKIYFDQLLTIFNNSFSKLIIKFI